jgi:hypothetical protein
MGLMSQEEQAKLMDFLDGLDSLPGYVGMDGGWWWFGDEDNPVVEGTNDIIRLFHFCRNFPNE